MMFGQATAEITPARWRRPAREHASSNCSHSSHAFRPREAMEPTAPKFHSLVSALSEAHRQELSASLSQLSGEANKGKSLFCSFAFGDRGGGMDSADHSDGFRVGLENSRKLSPYPNGCGPGTTTGRSLDLSSFWPIEVAGFVGAWRTRHLPA
jgi:hypothetical protein